MSSDMWYLIEVIAIAYLIGNISPSSLMARSEGIDIRSMGSGNAGTTNALRIMGAKAGLITLVVDVCKGTIATLVGALLAGEVGAMYCAVAVCVGHIWPIFYKFKGGKGVATAFGALLRVNPLIAVAAFGVLVVGVAISKRMSVGSILAAISFPVLAYFMKPEFLNFAICLAVIIVVKHSGNIIRLIKGTEPKISVLDKVREAQGGK